MKLKVIIIVFTIVGLSGGGFYYYKHTYVDTLLLSEIIGKTDNSFINFGVSLFDFDTGLTRHDIKQLKDHKDYWIDRINQVDAIQNSDQKQQASVQLLSDMMEDPALKKICSGFLKLGSDVSFGIIEMIL